MLEVLDASYGYQTIFSLTELEAADDADFPHSPLYARLKFLSPLLTNMRDRSE